MNHTPKGSQLHIGLFGKRNAGKSTLINGILRQDLAIVSPIPGTTTDTVHKSIEFHPIGPVVFVDTPGIDDEGALGELRIAKTHKTLEEVDAAIWLYNGKLDAGEKSWIAKIEKRGIPLLYVINQWEGEETGVTAETEQRIRINAKDPQQIARLRERLVAMLSTCKEQPCIGDYMNAGDHVLLVMPQDLQAPKGRLILPQVQIIRELLDASAIPVMTTAQTLDQALDGLKQSPRWAITDSQIFKVVYEKLPKTVKLTSFSILMARQKGDLARYVEGAHAAMGLKPGARVLIAESCTHNPLHGDIAREKLPQLLTKRLGHQVVFEHVVGNQFPDQLEGYELIVQCGGCMQTRAQIMARVIKADEAGIPITNFGVLLAHLGGILDQIFLP
ncbi:MAG: [FeFe] hydrogenase H-cluster maturation GTPase HydF [Cellulosilyticaceae bacterium]